VFAGALNDVDDVFQKDIRDVDLVHGLGRGNEVSRGAYGVVTNEVEFGFSDRAAVFFRDAQFEVSAENFLFFVGRRVVQSVAEHEAVELGFGEFEGSRLLDRVLGRDDQERGWQGEGLRAEGYFAFLHRFKKCALDLGGGAVDFVGKEEVGEDGAFVRAEGAGFLIEDLRADDVGRKKVDGKLNAAEV